MKADVVIIGAGVVGCACARELSRYKLNICVIEKEEDVCSGTSKANSGIVHAGYDALPGSMMAKVNVAGSKMMENLSKELDFDYRQNGSMIICKSKDDIKELEKLYDQGQQNGVEKLQILSADEARKIEPNLSGEVCAALFVPTGGIVCPFGLTIALAENACTNGVEFLFNTQVIAIEKKREEYKISVSGETSQDIYAGVVINAAGVYADMFHNMVSKNKIHITARRGAYCLLDKSVGKLVDKTIFELPNKKYGKGVLVTPTVHGNILLGPTATDIDDKEGTETTSEEIDELIQKAGHNVDHIPFNMTITSFAGLRAHEDGHEFIIGEPEDAKGFIDCAGIESPGLTSAPAIGVMVKDMAVSILNPEKKELFNPVRKDMVHPFELDEEKRDAFIKANPLYGNIICRCEKVTEGEIVDAIHRPLGARTLDGIKRRTRAGMGRCQAGFCSPKTMDIISRELGIPQEEITKNAPGSGLILQ